MQSFKPYFALAIVAGLALLWAALNLDNKQVETLYGFAQTAETEINSNYAIEILEILVEPGETVEKGQVLMNVKRARPIETLADQDFKIAELSAEERLTIQRLTAKKSSLNSEFERKKKDILAQKFAIESEIEYRKKLLKVLSPEEAEKTMSFDPDAARLKQLDDELDLLRKTLQSEISLLNTEIRMASKPYQAASLRLEAERDFDEEQQEVEFSILAPNDGVIGTINGKLAEYKSAFSPLISFYEPNPTQVKAYIHEDKIIVANVGDTVLVESITSDTSQRKGIIIGMGSRIIEIPARLRKMPDFQIFGREVIVSIPKSNPFLQNEKVAVRYSKYLNE